MSAAIAFELGSLAAQATMGAKRSYRDFQRYGVGAASARVIDSLPDVPGMQNLKALVEPAPRRRRKKATRKRKAKAKKPRRASAKRIKLGAAAPTSP